MRLDHALERLAQGGIPFSDRILQRVDGSIVKDLAGDAAHILDGECVGRGVAGGKGDHFRVGGRFENLTNQRWLERSHAGGKLIVHDGSVLSRWWDLRFNARNSKPYSIIWCRCFQWRNTLRC